MEGAINNAYLKAKSPFAVTIISIEATLLLLNIIRAVITQGLAGFVAIISVKVEHAVVSKVLRLWSIFTFSARIPVANCNIPGVIILGVDEIDCNGRCETAPAAALGCGGFS